MNRSIGHFISIADLERPTLDYLLEKAFQFEETYAESEILRNKLVATLFFEPSTRTRLSFEAATLRLGGRVIGFSDVTSTSVTKGETLKDTIKMVSNYADLIVIRHSQEGAARYASEVSTVPVINAGDGANQHPTQTLLDMYSILKTQKRLEGLHITLVGDLKYGRTVHSLIQALSLYKNITFSFISPESLVLPNEYKQLLRSRKVHFVEDSRLENYIESSDIIYMTRIQQERFQNPIDYKKVKNSYVLHSDILIGSKPTMKILHPLPRVGEISTDVDTLPYAYYFQQAGNGVFARMAVMTELLRS